MSQKFIIKNENFICQNCGEKNNPAQKTCRNHCHKCLYSKHIDNFPGDRKNNCLGLLQPVEIEIKGGIPTSIIFECQKCKLSNKNKIAEDDNRDAIFAIMEKFARN